MIALEILKNASSIPGFSEMQLFISKDKLDEAIKELEALATTTQSKFKVGDWVENITCTSPRIIKQVVNAPEGHDTVTVGNVDVGINVLLITDIKLWKPQPNEWCWVYNVTREVPCLRKVVRLEANYKNRFNDYKFTKAVIVSRGDTSGEVGYRFCEPFVGTLPSSLTVKE